MGTEARSAFRPELFVPLLLVATVLCLVGIEWSLPSAERNSFYPSEEVRMEVVTMTDGTHPYYGLWPIDSRHPDEKGFLAALSRINPGRLDFVPEGLVYGHMYVYLSGAAIFVAKLAGFVTLTSDRLFYALNPEEMARIFLVGRLLTALMGVLAVAMVYLLGWRLFDDARIGALAALGLTVSPVFVLESHYMENNVPMLLFLLLGVFGTWQIAEKNGGPCRYVLAGVLIGFAISNKPSAAFIGALVPMVHFYLYRLSRLWLLPVLAIGVVAGFLVTAPAFVIAPEVAMEGSLPGVANLQKMDVIATLRGFVALHGWPLSLWLVAGSVYVIVRAVRNRQLPHVFLAVLIVSATSPLFIGSGSFTRYTLPLLAASVIGASLMSLELLASHRVRRWPVIAGLVVVLGSAAVAVVHVDICLLRGPIQDDVTRYVASKVPRGARVATKVPMSWRDPLFNVSIWRIENLDDLTCERLPDYIVASEHSLAGLAIPLVWEERVSMDNVLDVPLLFPGRWRSSDARYVFDRYYVIRGPRCENQR